MIVLASRAGFFTAYQPLPDIGLKIAPHREKGVLGRWAAIKKELPDAPSSFLDVGCNVGFYVIEAAKAGHFSVGLDSIEHTKLFGIVNGACELRNASAVPMQLTPDNVRSLPTFDVIVIMQVFHHLCVAFGQEDACRILKTLWDRTGHKMIFEVESSGKAEEVFSTKMPDMGEESEAWIRRFFEDLGCADIRAIYRDEGHRRSVFAITK